MTSAHSTKPLSSTDIANWSELLDQHTFFELPLASIDGLLTGNYFLAQPFGTEGTYEASVQQDYEATDAEKALLQTHRHYIERRSHEISVELQLAHGFKPLIQPFVDDKGQPIMGRAGLGAVDEWIIGFLQACTHLQKDQINDETCLEVLSNLVHVLDQESLTYVDDALRCLIDQHKATVEPETLEEAVFMISELMHALRKHWKPLQPLRQSASTPRNAPCPCGSGLKFKRCCGQ